MDFTGKLQQAHEILDPIKRRHMQEHWLNQATASRIVAEDRKHFFNPHDGLCTGCGTRMHARVFADDSFTLFACPSCSWSHRLPYAIDEARRPAERWTHGVGGKKGTPTVTIGIDGKIKSIKGV